MPKADCPQSPEIVPAKIDTLSVKVDGQPTTVDTPPAATPKVDYPTDLFNMLSLDDASENGSGSSQNDDGAWAGFQCELSPVIQYLSVERDIFPRCIVCWMQ